jgi:hypothetical protein
MRPDLAGLDVSGVDKLIGLCALFRKSITEMEGRANENAASLGRPK